MLPPPPPPCRAIPPQGARHQCRRALPWAEAPATGADHRHPLPRLKPAAPTRPEWLDTGAVFRHPDISRARPGFIGATVPGTGAVNPANSRRGDLALIRPYARALRDPPPFPGFTLDQGREFGRGGEDRLGPLGLEGGAQLR